MSKGKIAAAIMQVCAGLIDEVNRDSAITITLKEDMRPYGGGFIRRRFLHGCHISIDVEYDKARPVLKGGKERKIDMTCRDCRFVVIDPSARACCQIGRRLGFFLPNDTACMAAMPRTEEEEGDE